MAAYGFSWQQLHFAAIRRRQVLAEHCNVRAEITTKD